MYGLLITMYNCVEMVQKLTGYISPLPGAESLADSIDKYGHQLPPKFFKKIKLILIELSFLDRISKNKPKLTRKFLA
jgi:hypothetical protein